MIQYNTILYNTTFYDMIQFCTNDTVQNNMIRCKTTRYKTILNYTTAHDNKLKTKQKTPYNIIYYCTSLPIKNVYNTAQHDTLQHGKIVFNIPVYPYKM